MINVGDSYKKLRRENEELRERVEDLEKKYNENNPIEIGQKTGSRSEYDFELVDKEYWIPPWMIKDEQPSNEQIYYFLLFDIEKSNIYDILKEKDHKYDELSRLNLEKNEQEVAWKEFIVEWAPRFKDVCRRYTFVLEKHREVSNIPLPKKQRYYSDLE